MSVALEDRFAGCLLGLAVGDALGAHFEGRSPEGIVQKYLRPQDLIERPPYGELWYTDDTQMALDVARSLCANPNGNMDDLAGRFLEWRNSQPKDIGNTTRDALDRLAELKVALAGLPPGSGDKYPSQLSGGMIKRAGVARALALDPDLLFLDEPTAGLDPVAAAALDELVLELRAALGLTVLIVTHDLDTLWRITDRVAFLGERRVLACEPIESLSRRPHPLIRQYFCGPRARAAEAAAED